MSDRRDITVTFDGSFEGLLTIIYKRYYEKLMPDRIVNRDCFQHTLYTDYVDVETDYEKAEIVMNALAKKISVRAQETAYMAYCASEEERYIQIFKYIILGFTKGREVDDYMKLDYVLDVQNYAKAVGREAHLYKGFVRFKEAKNGVFFSKIEPVNNIITFLAKHFSDRLAGQGWVIYDTKRELAAVFDGKEYIIADALLENEVLTDNCEDNYQALWRSFVSHIAVEGRKNDKLQKQLVPKRYRRFMIEFEQSLSLDTYEKPVLTANNKEQTLTIGEIGLCQYADKCTDPFAGTKPTVANGPVKLAHIDIGDAGKEQPE